MIFHLENPTSLASDLVSDVDLSLPFIASIANTDVPQSCRLDLTLPGRRTWSAIGIWLEVVDIHLNSRVVGPGWNVTS